MDNHVWMAFDASKDLVTLAEAGEWEEGDGLRVGLLRDHLVVTVKTPDRDCEIVLPITDLLDAIVSMSAKDGH